MKLKLIINGENDPRELALHSLLVLNEKITVTAVTQGSTQPTPEPEPEPAPDPVPDPVPNPAPEPEPTGCGPVPPNVRVRQTNAPGSTFLETIHSSQTSVGIIYAFAFDSGSSKGRVVATRVTNGNGKMIIVSKCPGDINTPAPGRSRAQSSESASVYYSTDPSDSRSHAVLEPNTIYYANVVNADSLDGTPPRDIEKCGFYFQKD